MVLPVESWSIAEENLVRTVVNATPIVEVSNIGGSAITLATGTAAGGFATTLGGVVFTAAPAAA